MLTARATRDTPSGAAPTAAAAPGPSSRGAPGVPAGGRVLSGRHTAGLVSHTLLTCREGALGSPPWGTEGLRAHGSGNGAARARVSRGGHQGHSLWGTCQETAQLRGGTHWPFSECSQSNVKNMQTSSGAIVLVMTVLSNDVKLETKGSKLVAIKVTFFSPQLPCANRI